MIVIMAILAKSEGWEFSEASVPAIAEPKDGRVARWKSVALEILNALDMPDTD